MKSSRQDKIIEIISKHDIETQDDLINMLAKEGYNIVIFPEDSAKGYLEELEGFFAGFVLMAAIVILQEVFDAVLQIIAPLV